MARTWRRVEGTFLFKKRYIRHVQLIQSLSWGRNWLIMGTVHWRGGYKSEGARGTYRYRSKTVHRAHTSN